MKKLKRITDFFDEIPEDEIYLNDVHRRYYRSQKGLYSKDPAIFDFIQFIKKWPDFLGGTSSYLALNSCPLKVKDRVLTIVTRHQVFSTELSYMAPVILKKLAKDFPKLAHNVQKINFINSERFFSPAQPEIKKEKEQLVMTNNKLHPFSPEFKKMQREANLFFEGLEESDEELKEIFLKLYINKEN